MALVVKPGSVDQTEMFGYAVAACLAACACYGCNGVLMKRYAAVPSRGIAVGGQSDAGATRALTVTYLMPLFAVLWGMLFLGESLPASALAGGVMILAGTVLVTRG